MIRVQRQAVPFCSSVEAMFELSSRIAFEIPLPRVDVIYVYGQTDSHKHSSLDRSAELFHRGITPLIGVPDLEPSGGYAGIDAWRSILVD